MRQEGEFLADVPLNASLARGEIPAVELSDWSFETFAVENSSTDGVTDALDIAPDVRVIVSASKPIDDERRSIIQLRGPLVAHQPDEVDSEEAITLFKSDPASPY